MAENDNFDEWCIVELSGHQGIAGKVSEQVISGQGFIRVDVPAVENQRAFTRLFGPGAIFSIFPVEEDIAKAFVVRNMIAPALA
jgi:hypothetical protein